MTNPKGTRAETALVRYAREHGFGQADRIPRKGKDGEQPTRPGAIAADDRLAPYGEEGGVVSILDGLDSLRVDLMNLHIPDDIAGTNNERLYRANAVGRDNGLIEAGIYVREALTNPTDEQTRGILARLRWADTDRTVADVRRVLAAAAGDDR